MKYIAVLFTLAAFLLIGCSNKDANPVSANQLSKQNPASLKDPATSLLKSSKNFQAHLNGAAEVSPINTNAQGEAIFRLSKDGNSIYYKLIVSNIDSVFMAHIHIAPAGSNGPIAVWLYPSAPPAKLIDGRFDGVLAEGTITSSDLTGPLADGSITDLLSDMQNGITYVNVHTSQNPGGEIRGQIK